MQRAADRDEPLHYFLEQPADDLRLAFLVVAGHERPDETARGHAAQTSALFRDENAGAVPRRGHGRADSRGAAADDKHVEIGFFFHLRSIRRRDSGRGSPRAGSGGRVSFKYRQTPHPHRAPGAERIRAEADRRR